MQNYYVYIICNKRNGTLYVGVTSDLINRIYEHKNKLAEGFSHEFKLNKLVYYEVYEDAYTAITREKNIKAWKRTWKLQLIEERNPEWEDLYDEILE